MSQPPQASLRVVDCPKDSRYILRGRRGKLYACSEHRHRADMVRFIEAGLITDTMMDHRSEEKCQLPVFKGTITI